MCYSVFKTTSRTQMLTVAPVCQDRHQTVMTLSSVFFHIIKGVGQ